VELDKASLSDATPKIKTRRERSSNGLKFDIKNPKVRNPLLIVLFGILGVCGGNK